MTITEEPLKCWAIIEQMGHRRLAGYCETVSVAGQAMLRVDVPEGGEHYPPYTTFIGGSSIFTLTPTDEEHVRLYVKKNKPLPAELLSLRKVALAMVARKMERAASLPSPAGDDKTDGDDDEPAGDWNEHMDR